MHEDETSQKSPDSTASKVCPRAKGCPLYAKFKVPSAREMWIALYCEAAYETCERYQLATAELSVPMNLLPNGRNLGD